MSNHVDSKAVTVSVKIYRRLLAAYPASFRRKFALEMQQVFHEQCRDAWSRAQGRSLALLWLRVLPDLTKTSLLQHLLILHRRESLCLKIVRAFRASCADTRLRGAFIRSFTVVFAAAFVCSSIVAICAQSIFFSTAQVETQPDSNRVERYVFDPYFAVIQNKIIQSYRILTNVIVSHHLAEKLAQQNGAARWSMDDTYEYLRNKISVEQVRMTSLIEISVRNTNPDLAAEIANAVADSYKQFRLDSWNETRGRGIKALKEKLDSETNELSRAQLKRLILREMSEEEPFDHNVVITNPAQPDWNSVVPTKLKIFLMWILGGTLIAAMAGGGVAWFAGHRSAR
jgi:capsular polysaccharide biosynthesis protein